MFHKDLHTMHILFAFVPSLDSVHQTLVHSVFLKMSHASSHLPVLFYCTPSPCIQSSLTFPSLPQIFLTIYSFWLTIRPSAWSNFFKKKKTNFFFLISSKYWSIRYCARIVLYPAFSSPLTCLLTVYPRLSDTHWLVPPKAHFWPCSVSSVLAETYARWIQQMALFWRQEWGGTRGQLMVFINLH